MVLTRVLDERPDNVVDIFEDVSKDTKRSKFTSNVDTVQDKIDKSTEVALAQIQKKLFSVSALCCESWYVFCVFTELLLQQNNSELLTSYNQSSYSQVQQFSKQEETSLQSFYSVICLSFSTIHFKSPTSPIAPPPTPSCFLNFIASFFSVRKNIMSFF